MSHPHAPALERLDAPSAPPDVLAEFGEYLRTQRRLAPLTISTRTDVVRRFLRWRAAGHGALDLHRLSVTDVHRFVVSEASRLR